MNNIVNVLVTVIVSGIVATGAVFVFHPHTAVQSNEVGSLAGPVIASPFLQWGGVTHWGSSAALATGSSTVCAIQSPAATSTLHTAWMRVDTTPNYATTYEIGYNASTKNSTSTALVASYTIGAQSYGTIIATTTLTALVDGVVGPNSWINFNVSTSTAAGLSQATGACGATFEQL